MTARVRLEDLPPAVRRKITARTRGSASPRARAAGTATGRARGSAPRWRCHNCGEMFTVEAHVLRHAHDGSAARIEWLL